LTRAREVQAVVVDASVVVEFLLCPTRNSPLHAALGDDHLDLYAPSLCDIEVAAGIRRALLRGMLSRLGARARLTDLRELPIRRCSHTPLLPRVVDLFDNFSAYDAAYVALAEGLDAPLMTADTSLGRATRTHTKVPVISSPCRD